MGEEKKSSRKSSEKEKKSKDKEKEKKEEKKEEKKSDRKSERKSDRKSSSRDLDRHSSHSRKSDLDKKSSHKSSKHERKSRSSHHRSSSSSSSHHHKSSSSSSRHRDDDVAAAAAAKEQEDMDGSKDSIDSFENYRVPPIQFKELPEQETDSDKSDGEIAEVRPAPQANPAVLKLKEEASKMDAYLDDLDSELHASVNELTDTNKAFVKKSRRISCLEGYVYRDDMGAITEGISDSEDDKEEKVHPVHGAKEFDWEKYGKQKADSL